MDSEILERIEKQMEGNGLALAAVAEVLQKMDARLHKAEEEEEEDKEREEEAAEMEWAVQEKAELVKAVAAETVELIKGGQYSGESGMDVDGEKVKNAKSAKGGIPSTGGASGADDSETAVTINTDTDKVQGVIQAMQKQLDMLKEGMPWDDAEGTDEDEDEAASQDEPKEDELDEAGDKNVSYSVENLEKMVAAETDKRLRKMGFKEETSLMRPTIIDHNNMGTDGGTPISKGQNLADSGDEVVDQLADLSYKQLRDLQMQVESGETEGVPKELISS